ncbi:MAG: hypothetical protein N2235_03475 [Fischerella sp.]|nr:hypothetical protein [Fischerella sp.]
MTRYSIPSQTTPENLVNSTSDNYQPEVDSSSWEYRMARLVGFEEESPVFAADDVEIAKDSATPPPPPATRKPEASTQQPLSSNPFAKLALVGTGTFALVLLAGGFLSQLMNAGNQKPKKNNIIVQQPRSRPTAESRLEQLETELETLKTKLALAEQAQAVRLAQQKLRTEKMIPATPTPPPVISRPRVPTPVKTVYVPKVETRVVRVPQPQQQPLPQQTISAPIAKPETQPNVELTPPPPPDPMQEWARLAKLGSYGQVSVAAAPTDAPTDNTINRTPPEPVQNPTVQPQATNPQPQANPQSPQPETSSIIGQAQTQNPKSVAVGTSTKAVLATAIFGETSRATNNNSKNDNSGKNLFVVRLKEPLKAIDGTVVLPAKTEILTEISSLSEQGLLQLNAVKLINQNNGSLTERSLPENAILIRGSEGRPLIANQYKKGGSSLLWMDAGQFVLGAAGKVGEIFNRTESEVVRDGDFSYIRNKNPQRNILAGILEGGVRTVVPQITQRNQQAMSQMMQRSNIWFLPAGTEVEIYVNQMMSF